MKKLSLKGQVKVLKNDLEHKEKSLSDAYRKIYELEHEQEKKKLREGYESEIYRQKTEIDRLLEIIRWQINPVTTRHPFDKALDEKTQAQKDRNW